MIIVNWKGAKIIVGYIKACDVLPDDLISWIQEYIDGEYLYIPRKKENKKSWGEISGVKKDLSIRNREIYLKYKSGIAISNLAEDYYLSEKTIRKIISMERHKSKVHK